MFRRCKKATREIDEFVYDLEKNLFSLWRDLRSGRYQHGGYRKFVVTDNKRREIAVAAVSDRVVHRLLYEYLVKIYDKTFIYDAWSCRKGKGVLGAIERTQSFLRRFRGGIAWRGDITKFFDNVDHDVLRENLNFRVKEEVARRLLRQVIQSYRCGRATGIPIGNLTSQIFANIYLNELDRFVKHTLKPQAYLRYGDDFVIMDQNKTKVEQHRLAAIKFVSENLKMQINPKNDIVILCERGLKFLGVEIYPKGRRLKKRNWKRAMSRLNYRSLGSYWGLISAHESAENIKYFQWRTIDFYEQSGTTIWI